jgi:hypothetical protein
MRRMENSSLTDQTAGAERPNTVTFKLSHFYAVLVVFALAAGILIDVAWNRVVVPAQQAATAPAQAQSPGAQAAEPAEDTTYTRYDIETDGYPSLGPEDAEIVLVEFSDYQ